MLSALLCLVWLLPAEISAKDYFTAAVFEHRPAYLNSTAVEYHKNKEGNLPYYEKAVQVASQQGVDIILFNEYGPAVYPMRRDKLIDLAEHIPDPKKHRFNPCLVNAKDRPVLHTASCLARKHKMYIVANLLDAHPCEGSCDANQIDECDFQCPEDGMYFYNTDVAFDREGNIIARYHKVHPYFEAVNVPDGPEFITFDTEFGKFGMLVCFDLVFDEAIALVKEHSIDTLLFPTFWFDDIVPLISVEFQQSFAIATGVNFMAANTHVPGRGSIGSGIYTKDDGALVYTYEPNGLSKLLIANIPIKKGIDIPSINSITAITKDEIFPVIETGEKFPEQSYEPLVGAPKNALEDYRHFKLKLENYTVSKLEKPSGKVQVCSNDLCCSLTYSAEDMNEDFYLAAFSGLNNVKNYYEWWEQTCIVTRCDPYESNPCVLQPLRSKTVFKNVELEGNFEGEYVFPSVSKTNMRLAPRNEWNVEQKGGKTKLVFIPQSDAPLLRITLMGRDYERDPPFIPFWKF